MKKGNVRPLTANEFFKELSGRLNYLDINTVEEFYYSLVKLILLEIKNKGSVKLPNFGSFKVNEIRPRRIFNVNTKEHDIVSSFLALKFDPCIKLRDYVKNIEKNQ